MNLRQKNKLIEKWVTLIKNRPVTGFNNFDLFTLLGKKATEITPIDEEEVHRVKEILISEHIIKQITLYDGMTHSYEPSHPVFSDILMAGSWKRYRAGRFINNDNNYAILYLIIAAFCMAVSFVMFNNNFVVSTIEFFCGLLLLTNAIRLWTKK